MACTNEPSPSRPAAGSPFRSSRVGLLLPAVGALACASAAEPAPAQLSLVANGSFEAHESGAPQGWTLQARSQGASATLDSAQHSHGRRALRLEAVRQGEVTASSAPFTVQAGRFYLLSLDYRAEGMAVEGRYAGVWARIDVVWAGPEGALGSEGIRAPYRSLDWKRFLRMLRAPDGASSATVRATLSASAGSPPTRVWLDELRYRPWSTHPSGDGEEWTWYAADPEIASAKRLFRAVADEQATKGRSVIAHPAHHPARRTMFKVADARDLPPGAYRVDFRLKAGPDDAGSAKDPIATIDVFLDNGSPSLPLVGRELTGGDFPDPTRYETFSLPFVRPPGDRVTFRVHWLGEVPVWVDTVTVRPERLENERGFADVLAR